MHRWLLLVLVACRPPGYGEDPDRPDGGVDAGARPDAPDGSDGPGPDATPVTCDATFRLEGYATAGSVSLTGDFVGWAGTPEAGAVALTLEGEVWTGARTFDEGQYLYKFVVDGTQWIADPGNPEQVDDGFGGYNSVYRCE